MPEDVVVTVVPDANGEPKVGPDYQANAWDRYNWDKGPTSRGVRAGVRIPGANSRKAGRGPPMNSPSSESCRERTARRRLQVLGVVVLAVIACVAAAVGGFAYLADEVSSDQTDEEMNCCWESGATPAWMSEKIGIRIPEAAADRRAGYKTGSRYDTGLLSFTLRSQEADAYTSRLIRKGTKMIRNFHPEKKDYRPAAAFAHLKLPEPETFVEGLRQVSLCPDDLNTPEGRYLQRCVDLFAHEYKPGSTRIYVRSTIEPGLTPPPATTK
ncbi:hypothetical protein OG729_07665 [Streptomyces sp. NBC_00210]|uniref:hypothetical protein n=1 Tax=unclassified Streptomyces TaxID=2593676 RepID=UPI0032460904